MRLPFMEGAPQQKGSEVNATVSPGNRPYGNTISGRVTSKPGRYTLSISLDAMQPGMTTPLHIAQEIPVIVK
jgi:hypothetical protein